MANSASAKRNDENKIGLGIKITLIVVAILCVFMLVYTVVDSMGILDRNTTAMTIGEEEISVIELNQYYHTTRNGFVNQYYDVLAMYGYDLTSGTFDNSYSLFDSTMTWRQYFMEEAKAAVQEVSMLSQEAEKAGYVMSEDDKAQFNVYMDSLATAAEDQDMSVNQYVKLLYGKGTKVSDVEEYYTKRVYAAGYYKTLLEGFGIDDAAIDAHYNEHKEDYDVVEYYAFDVKYDTYTYSADSTEEGAPKSEEEATAMTAASKEAAEKDAQALLNKLAADGSNFDETIQAYEGSDVVYAGGHKEVTIANASTALQTWMKEDGRAVGDKAVVADETNKAYTVVVYLGTHQSDEYTVAVRHTLLTTEEIGTYATEAEAQEIEARNAQVKAEAEALYQEWVNGGASEETFIQMAKDHSEDGNASSGGLYSGVYMGQMVEAFQDWCFDEARQPGDHGIVETEFGYHIMYFVENEGLKYRSDIKSTLESEKYNEYLTGLTEVYDTDVNTKAVDMM